MLAEAAGVSRRTLFNYFPGKLDAVLGDSPELSDQVLARFRARGAGSNLVNDLRELGNDLSTPRPEYGFPGLRPGDRWCVVAVRWLQAYQAGAAAGVVLAATNERALEIVPIEALRQHAVDVPDDISALE